MKGFLFIGDPHVSSLRPGRRIDDYVSSVLEKLRLSGEIARSLDLMPVILGDLFHRARENHLPTLSRLTEVLQSYPCIPIVLGGNHDKDETRLQEADALYLLAQTGTVEVYDGECREARLFDFEGVTAALWVAPYGAALPDSIESAGAEYRVLVTHHDLAFEGAYPGAALLQEIKGCEIAVNGHMHKTAPWVSVGDTTWHCPGNIEPLSVDCIDHEPAVWAWTPAHPRQLARHLLPHVRDCFDLTGLIVDKASGSESVEALINTQASDFADLLAAQSRFETALADDKDAFVEELNAAMLELGAPEYVQKLLSALATKETVPAV